MKTRFDKALNNVYSESSTIQNIKSISRDKMVKEKIEIDKNLNIDPMFEVIGNNVVITNFVIEKSSS